MYVPRKESGSKKCKRRHGGVCLFVHEYVRKGIELLETNDSGFIWVKLSKLNSSILLMIFAYALRIYRLKIRSTLKRMT